MARTPTRDRIVELRRVPASDLRANPKNWRRHPSTQATALRSVIDKVGYAGALLARETDDGLELIDGHLRQEIADGTPVPVLVLDVDQEEADLILATLDPLGAMAVTDEQALFDLLQDVLVPDPVLAAALEEMTGQAGPPAMTADPDEVPELPDTPTTRPGDIWILGEHRLLCGDATLRADVAQLLAGSEVALIWTDPPYGVAYAGHDKVRKTIANDQLNLDALQVLVGSAFKLAAGHSKPGATVYCTAAQGPAQAAIGRALHEVGAWRQTLVWVKDVFVMGHLDYHYRHETLFYGWLPGSSHTFNGDRTLDSIWEIPRPKTSDEHPTMKPVELVARAVRLSSLPGELVYDPFAGSGTSLIAAEDEGRRASVIEIDPAYCDVIVARWEGFTGQKAEVQHADA